MKTLRTTFLTTILAVSALATPAKSVAQTAQTPSTTLAGARWWWLGSAVTPEGLTWNMEQMASHGIGAVEITPLYGVQGNDQNNLPFLSPQWMNALQHTLTEGKRLGIQVDMNLGTGWPFGGPTTPVEEAACMLAVVDTIVSNAAIKGADMSKPLFPAPLVREKGKMVPDKFAEFILQKVYKTQDKTKSRVIVLYQSRTRQQVKRAAPGGQGYVIDHFDRTAVKHYLDKFDAAFSQTATPLWPATFFNDSYEVYQADWTPTLLTEFKARRGYALESKLQEFIDGDPQVISDYRETLSDLLLENFTQQWVAWSHSHGVKVRNQAHGSPANLIDIYAAVDIPEIEGFGLSEFGIKGLRKDPGFTKKNFSDLSMLKYASSAAHITGKPLVSSETFTWLTEHFRTSLSQMKPDLDLMFCSGVNRMFFHGACYSPKDDPWPGWRFYASVDMSPTNSIWRDAPELMNYIKFCQERLQAGQPDNDFLVLLPVRNMWRNDTKNRLMQFDIHSMDKKAPEFIANVLKIDSLGYDCDYISEKYLLTTSYVDGKLQTAAGTRYSGLILPGECILTKAVEKHIADLKAQGAIIINKIEADAMAAAAKPEMIRTELGLKMIRRIVDGKYQYFVSNLTPNDVNEQVTLAAAGKQVRLNLRSGESCFITAGAGEAGAGEANDVADNNGRRRGPRRDVRVEYPIQHGFGIAKEVADLSQQPWALRFVESQPAVSQSFVINGLQTWENGLPSLSDGSAVPAAVNDSLRTLMGTGVYETLLSVEMPQMPQHANGERRMRGPWFRLDLGDVRESARVYLNNKYVGTAWCVPMTLDFPADMLAPADKNGNSLNVLRIEVTNLPANRIADYDRRGIKWRKFNEINVVDLNYKRDTYENWAPVPSGLNSTVKLYMLSFGERRR